MRCNARFCVLFVILNMQACVRESAIAVEPKKCGSDACADPDTPDGATHAPDAAQRPTIDAAAADGGRHSVDAGNHDASVTEDAGTTLPPVPQYTLVVDDPYEGATLDGSVTIRGRSAGFLNVEVWDATHQKPPLARVTPNADGTFTLSVDTSALTPGPMTWTVWGWDSPAGQSYAHTASVTLHLTLRASSSTW